MEERGESVHGRMQASVEGAQWNVTIAWISVDRFEARPSITRLIVRKIASLSDSLFSTGFTRDLYYSFYTCRPPYPFPCSTWTNNDEEEEVEGMMRGEDAAWEDYGG